MKLKQCIKCGIEKSRSDYHQKLSAADGCYPVCKECRREGRPARTRKPLADPDNILWLQTFAVLAQDRFGIVVDIEPGATLADTKERAAAAVQASTATPKTMRDKLKARVGRTVASPELLAEVDALTRLGMRLRYLQKPWRASDCLHLDPEQHEILADMLSANADQTMRKEIRVLSSADMKKKRYREFTTASHLFWEEVYGS